MDESSIQDVVLICLSIRIPKVAILGGIMIQICECTKSPRLQLTAWPDLALMQWMTPMNVILDENWAEHNLKVSNDLHFSFLQRFLLH